MIKYYYNLLKKNIFFYKNKSILRKVIKKWDILFSSEPLYGTMFKMINSHKRAFPPTFSFSPSPDSNNSLPIFRFFRWFC